MSKKQTFEEFSERSQEHASALEAQIQDTELKIKQQEHRIQRSENLVDYIKNSKRKRRNKRMIRKGIAIESICKDTELLEEMEFYELMEELFCDQTLRDKISKIVAGRREQEDEDQRLLEEAEATIKAGSGV